MAKRIWNVRLNVDEFNAAMVGLDSEQERLSFLSGFHAGLNGKPKSDKGDQWASGWSIANACFEEANAFSEKQKANVNKRYQTSTMVAPPNNQMSTNQLPIEQSTIEQSTIYERASDEPESALARAPVYENTKDKKIISFLEGVGALTERDGKSLLVEWKGVLKGCKQPFIEAIFKQAKPGILWPSQFKEWRSAKGNY
jgi:hypothetical protein